MTTPRINADELAANQSQPHLTLNASLRRTEQGANSFVILRDDLATPPVSPADGNAYIVAAMPTGAWVGQTDSIAYRNGTAWSFIAPSVGMQALNLFNGERLQYESAMAGWVADTPGGPATGVSYTPTTGTDWTDPDPVNVQQALDDLAMRVGGGATGRYLPPIRYMIDTLSVADSDPGPGVLRFNNASQSAATFIYIDNQTASAVGLTTLFAGLPQTGFFALTDIADVDVWHIYKITSVVSATGYYKIGVLSQAFSGSFADDAIALLVIDADASGGSAATGVSYTPTVPADWPDPDPTNVQQGLDKLAERVADIEAAPGGAQTQCIPIACSDETSALTTGTAKVTFRMPYALTLSAVRSSLTAAPTGSTLVVDINESGVSILSTKLSIDATEKTSTTAATPVVISDALLADDAEITIDIDQIGSTIAGAGLKVYLIGTKTP